MEKAGFIDSNRRGLCAWIVVSKDFQEFTVARAFFIRGNDAVTWLMFSANAAQSYTNHNLLFSP
jgi:hypothetical protein